MTHKERLRQLRKENNFSQIAMSKLLDIPQTTYSSYETGVRRMTIDTLAKLSEFYNVSTDYLLGLSDVRERR